MSTPAEIIIDAEEEEPLGDPLEAFQTEDPEEESDAIRAEPMPDPPRVVFEEPEPQPIGRDGLQQFLDEVPANTDITVVVHRKPDRGLIFMLPCDAKQHVANIYWDGRTASEIYEHVQTRFGGGRYQFQLQYGGGFKNAAWEITISDPAEPSLAWKTQHPEKAKSEEYNIPNPSPAFVNGNEPRREPSRKSVLKELVSEIKELEEVRNVLMPKSDQPANTMSAEDQIKLKLFEAMSGREELQDKLTDYAFGIFKSRQKEEEESIWSVLKTAIKNPQQSVQLLSGVVNMARGFFTPGPGAAPPAASLLSAIPAATVPAAPGASIPGLRMPPAESQVSSPPSPAETQQQAAQIAIKPLKRVKW